jgi:protoheme IX farnesyltransferase
MAGASDGKAVFSLPASYDAGSAGDYLALMKPRVMSLVIFTAGVGLAMAPGSLHPVLTFAALAMIALGAGGSAAINMWYDADIDSQMRRTKLRPIPAGKISADSALSFGLWMSGIAILSLAVLIDYTSAALLAFTIFFYGVIYTIWLKRRTPQNIVIGGAAGALPPVVGWAAVSSVWTLEPWLYFLIIFIWTPPHFWALALLKEQEYEAVKIPMLPNTHGVTATKVQIMIYSLLLVGASLLPAYFGFAGAVYLTGVAAMNIAFMGLATWLALSGPAIQRPAKWLFAFSIFYLFILFALLPLDRSVMG